MEGVTPEIEQRAKELAVGYGKRAEDWWMFVDRAKDNLARCRMGEDRESQNVCRERL